MCLALNETAREGLAQLSFFYFIMMSTQVTRQYRSLQEVYELDSY